MDDGWTCDLCNAVFVRTTARARHMQNVWKREDDPTRCDNVAKTRQQVPLITVPMVAPLLDAPTQLAVPPTQNSFEPYQTNLSLLNYSETIL